jgi:hypothetical protein
MLGLICYHMVGLQPELTLLYRFLLVLVLFNVTSACCCLMISIVCSDQGVASLIATLVMLFEMLFGGLLLNKNSIPPTFQWMNRLSFFNYAFEALVVNEVAGLTLVEEKFGFKIDVLEINAGSWCAGFADVWIECSRILARCAIFRHHERHLLGSRIPMATVCSQRIQIKRAKKSIQLWIDIYAT